MAEIVLGIGTSHSPMLSLDPKLWYLMSEADRIAPYLVDPESGEPASYDELLARRPDLRDRHQPEQFEQQWQACQDALLQLKDAIAEARPDVLVIVSDDQEEIFYDDNMPMFLIYWGESVRLIPRHVPAFPRADVTGWVWGYGDKELTVPVESDLGRHLIEHLVANDFDIAHSRYLKPDHQYGGAIGPAGYVKTKRTMAPRRQGLPHGWSFVIKRLLDNNPIPIVPVAQNTVWPPNTPTPTRCYRFGQALRNGIESWSSDKRVAVVASGGLSHYVTDEVVDRQLLDAIVAKEPEKLFRLPERRLRSAASEIKNWITAAGICEGLQAEIINYIPVYRTEAGTGGGWAFVQWK